MSESEKKLRRRMFLKNHSKYVHYSLRFAEEMADVLAAAKEDSTTRTDKKSMAKVVGAVLAVAGLITPVSTSSRDIHLVYSAANVKLALARGVDPVYRIGGRAYSSMHEYVQSRTWAGLEVACEHLTDGKWGAMGVMACMMKGRSVEEAAVLKPVSLPDEHYHQFVADAESAQQPLLELPFDDWFEVPTDEIAARLEHELVLALTLIDEVDLEPLPSDEPFLQQLTGRTERAKKRPVLTVIDKRNKWIYEQLSDLTKKSPEVFAKYKELCPKQDWPDTLGSERALFKAGEGYAKKHGKRPIPPRKSRA